ncbi:hypothetical protein BDM02DRAFT_3113186 [Thelephora ganbajun]|uniref:Uncharacterized protein n=1 Tax=Thelephora ganbajun TaxID=370292 RepID=A0ACB6ZJM9_THEGA|nr:hypothetical protein BDM02DRAFT_3113186 [Thelephora ganbajun]
MTLHSTSDSSPIFKDGRLKPGIYKIQNIFTEAFLDIEVHSRNVCCRPAQNLREGRGLWEIKQFGAGYTVQRVEPGKPEQFCTPSDGVNSGTTLRVAAYPVAWRVEMAEDEHHRGFEYVRFYWATGKIVWDPSSGSNYDGVPVQTYPEALNNAWQVWSLVPVKVEDPFMPPRPSRETVESGSLPSYEGDSEQSSTRAQHTESEHDELGTVVNEVTVVTTTVTTRKRYRVEDA